VEVLRTPSSDVQQAVSECLGPLMAGLADDETFAQTLIQRLLDLLLKGHSYADRCPSLFQSLQLQSHHTDQADLRIAQK